jgi:hypothetical protein
MNPGDKVLVRKTLTYDYEDIPAVFVRDNPSNWPYQFVAKRTDYENSPPENWAVCRLAPPVPPAPLFKSAAEGCEFWMEVKKATKSRALDNALEVAKALQSEVLRVEDIPPVVLHVLRYFLSQGETK